VLKCKVWNVGGLENVRFFEHPAGRVNCHSTASLVWGL
jgi:hypothetical protein